MTNWGLLSTARINEALLRGIAGVPDARALAVASRDPERARAYAESHGIARAHGSYEALLADDEVEIVYVSLPNGLHVEWTRRALEAGKHVLCEKPLSRSPAEAEQLFDLAERRGLRLSEAFMYRHHPQTVRLGELVRGGAVGELRLIRVTFSFTCDPADPRMRAGLDGGGLMDVGCYPVSMARHLAGEPQRVSAEQRVGGDGVDVVMAGTLRFPGEVIAQFDSGLALPARRGLEIVGSTATIRVADPWHPPADGIELWPAGAQTPEIVPVPAANAYALEVANLGAAIRGEAEPLLGRADAVGQARTIAALYASAQAGAVISL
ncbi:MAG TPA: Gfo/Idh/MocA family oxidoreductase [Solirubrobacteraceae bacterium]|nr:Gfo/Idh/MocA family oxidoreductase [Solirubrobacteraceae bacterium]